jgi:tetratricopeptide (TPR) repeat protein
MTAFRKDVPRRIIPRWHSLEAALRQGELRSLRKAEAGADEQAQEELDRNEQEWRETRKLSAAAELVASSVVIGASEEAAEAAQALVDAEYVPELARRAAQRLLQRNVGGLDSLSAEAAAATLDPEAHAQQVITTIAALKRSLYRDPRQALAWAELARQYEALNQRDQARRAMSMALRLAPSSRFVLRAAARLAVHHDDPEEGHALLSRAPRTRVDPWLVSAEIALASLADRGSHFLKHGRRMLDSGQFSSGDTTELASALATEELMGARLRQARKLFERSLEDPTENTVAQVEWASHLVGGLELDPHYLDTPDSYEARAWQHAQQGEWPLAVENSWLWLATLPFAEAPGVFGSYQASLGGDYAQGAALARAALLANPDEFLLHNNLAVCLLQLDLVDEAEQHLREMTRLDRTDLDHVVYLATNGLRAFRTGDVGEGRRLYRDAIHLSTDPGLRAAATISLAREEILAGTVFAEQTAREAISAAETTQETVHVRRPFLALMLDQLVAARREHDVG